MSSSDCQELNVAALNDYLETQLPGYAGPLALTRFADGQSNPTFKLTSRNGSYAMRTKRGLLRSCCRRPTRSSVNIG